LSSECLIRGLEVFQSCSPSFLHRVLVLDDDNGSSRSERRLNVWSAYPTVLSRYANVKTVYLQNEGANLCAIPQSLASLLAAYEQVTIASFFGGSMLYPDNVLQLEGLDFSRVTVLSASVATSVELVWLQKLTAAGLSVQELSVGYQPAQGLQATWSSFYCSGLKTLNISIHAEDASDTLRISEFLRRHPSLAAITASFPQAGEVDCILTQGLYEPGVDRTCTLNITYGVFFKHANSLVPAYGCTRLWITSDCPDLNSFASVVSRVAKCYPELGDLTINPFSLDTTAAELIPVSCSRNCDSIEYGTDVARLLGRDQEFALSVYLLVLAVFTSSSAPLQAPLITTRFSLP